MLLIVIALFTYNMNHEFMTIELIHTLLDGALAQLHLMETGMQQAWGSLGTGLGHRAILVVVWMFTDHVLCMNKF